MIYLLTISDTYRHIQTLGDTAFSFSASLQEIAYTAEYICLSAYSQVEDADMEQICTGRILHIGAYSGYIVLSARWDMMLPACSYRSVLFLEHMPALYGTGVSGEQVLRLPYSLLPIL